ncbi:MAG: CorA family divalent cation transporter [Candidatus Eiseniibacteriota bacterium]
MPPKAGGFAEDVTGSPPPVRQFRQILLWPLQLSPLGGRVRSGGHAGAFGALPGNAWREAKPAVGDPARFRESDYAEFVAFLPHVQRFLYGESSRGRAGYGGSPIRVFERDDVAGAQVVLAPGDRPIALSVEHCALYFFYDIDVALFVLEVASAELPLASVEDLSFRFARAYPASWTADGLGERCPVSVEWIGRGGGVLARSDFEDRERYVKAVARTRAPCFALHWEWLLAPMVPDASEAPGPIRYRQLEYYRMPFMAYLAFDDPRALEREDFVRLGLATGPSRGHALPIGGPEIARFEEKSCYDRYWSPGDGAAPGTTRFLCTGHAFLLIGRNGDPYFTNAETGLLGQFRRQYFLLGLIAHFHKAALLMLSDRLVLAISRLDIDDVESIKAFKRIIRRTSETFLRFTHRYWFHEVSTQDQSRDLFRLWTGHIDVDRLYDEVRTEIQDMSDYLDSDSIRRQANTVVRLTVVTTLGLIGTVATGVLGMNVFALADRPWTVKVLYFLVALGATGLLTFFTVWRSKRLSGFLEALAEEGNEPRERWEALRAVWARRPRNAAGTAGPAGAAGAAGSGGPETRGPVAP